MARLLALVLGLSLSLSLSTAQACRAVTPEVARMQTATLRLSTPEGVVAVPVRVADESVEWRAGFQHICPTSIRQQQIWFAFPHPSRGKFHMNNVHAPLDIAFFAADGTLLEVFEMKTYRNGHRPLYGPKSAFQYALEAHAGYFRAHHIAAGSRVIGLDK